MGRYRLSIYWKWQLGVCLLYEDGFIIIDIPLVSTFIYLGKGAYGRNFWNFKKQK